MSISDRLPPQIRRSFSPATLRTADTAAAASRVSDLAFFRAAYSATVVEHERRRFLASFVVDASGDLGQARCSCSEKLRPRDCCRHIAIAAGTLLGGDPPALASDRFESSLWHALGQSLLAECGALPLTHDRSGETITTIAGARALLSLRLDSAHSAPLRDLLGWVYLPEERSPLIVRLENLRRIALTDQEKKFAERGVRSRRQEWEDSFWYRWSRLCFELFDGAPALVRSGDLFRLRCTGSEAEALIDLPGAVVEVLVEHDAGAIARQSGFGVETERSVPSLRLRFDDAGALHFTPMLIVEGRDGKELLDRQELEAERYGRYFYLHRRRLFIRPRNPAPLFAERVAGQQSLLLSASHAPSALGMPFDRETVVGEEEVFAFLERHREEIAHMPAELLPESLREAAPSRAIDRTVFRFGPVAGRDIMLSIDYVVGGQTIDFATIARRRRTKGKTVNRGNVWLDAGDPQFSWMDAIDEASLRTEADRSWLRPSRLDYLRIRSHVRGVVEFEGDASARSFWEAFEAMRAAIDAPPSSELGLDLYGYQQSGYQWLWFLHQNDLGGLLCDDMGLGKTHQAMALVAAVMRNDPELARERHTSFQSSARSAPSPAGGQTPTLSPAGVRPRLCPAGGEMTSRTVLIVCPTSLLDHWREKLETWVPGLVVETWHGADRGLPTGRIVITSYGTLRNSADQLRDRWFDLVILDEIQAIKNRSTATYQALATLRRRMAIGLTGTPIENRIGELKSLLDFVVPGYLPGDAAFERAYATPIEQRGDDRARERLHRLISPFVLRRTKSQVLTELPEKIVDKRHCELTPEQRELYREIAQSKGAELRQRIDRHEALPWLHVFATLNYLKQVCNHPAILPGGRGAGIVSGKWNLFCELLDETLSSGLKVVVFSQYVRMLALIESHLGAQNVGFATIKGATRNRGAMIERFHRDPDCRVFTASLRAGGVGIDLTPASVVIHYDRWWNQAREDQATDRVHRLGQNKGVQVIKLITRGTLEEKIDRMIEAKERLAAGVVREDDPSLVKQFSRDELRELLAWNE